MKSYFAVLTDHVYVFSNSPVPDYVKSTVETVMKIHQTEGDGDILAFLTGQVDTKEKFLSC